MIKLKLAPHVEIEREKEGKLLLSSSAITGGHDVTLTRPSPSILNCLKKLQGDGAEEETLAKQQEDLTKFYYFLELLKTNNLLSYTLASKNISLLTLHPLNTRFRLDNKILIPQEKLKLSKFAFLRTNDKGLVLETPLSPVECEIHSPEISNLLHQLAKPHAAKEIRSSLPRPLLENLLLLLLNAKILIPAKEEEKDPLAQQWEFHDLLFHTRTRIGRHINPYGGTYPFKKTIAPLSVCKPAITKTSISLFKPDIEKLKREDRPLTRVIEERRSKREHDKDPLTIKQLGEFLFRTARMKELVNSSRKEGLACELSRRPYPGGGAIYELELYLFITDCKGLEKGAYHYHPENHALYRLEVKPEKIEALILDACRSTGKETAPQVLFTITSRFQRMSWKYRSMAYAATLKNTGVLLQTMYLVATAMDLAPCAIGGGNADLFSEAAGTNYLEETSVGEFMLGSQKKC